MNLDKFVALLHATAEPWVSRVLIQLPTGEFALVKSVTSSSGEIVVQTTLDVREEII